MNDLLQNEFVASSLQSMTAYDFFVRVMAVLIFIGVIAGITVTVYKLFEKYRKLMNSTEEKEHMVEEHQKEIEELKEDDNKIWKTVKDMDSKIDSLAVVVLELRRRNDSIESAKLKDRIAQAYGCYSVTKQWTRMQRESLEDLIKAYENYSQNSFVHDVVQKEMYSWKIIDEEQETVKEGE